MSTRTRIALLLGNFLPFTLIVLFALPWWIMPELSSASHIALSLGLLYLLPPLLCRFFLLILGRPERFSHAGTRSFLAWWFTSQTQVIFLRFSFLEEALRLVPSLYSGWLRLWGAKVGKLAYWSPGIVILDRPFLKIGDYVVLGYGARMSSHAVVPGEGSGLVLHFGEPVVGSRAVLGALSGLGPDSEVGEGELLPATLLLAPGTSWVRSQKRRRT